MKRRRVRRTGERAFAGAAAAIVRRWLTVLIAAVTAEQDALPQQLAEYRFDTGHELRIIALCPQSESGSGTSVTASWSTLASSGTAISRLACLGTAGSIIRP